MLIYIYSIIHIYTYIYIYSVYFRGISYVLYIVGRLVNRRGSLVGALRLAPQIVDNSVDNFFIG
jgi:hypothetical protein